MNNVLFSRERDNQIVNLIESGTIFSRNQIERLFFPNYKSAKRKAQERLCKLVQDKRIKRYQKDYAMPSLYYIERKPINTEHYISINEIYVQFMLQKKPWQTIEWKWTYDINNMVLVDAMAILYLEPDKKRKVVVWIEYETNSKKRFDKDQQYERIFSTNWDKEPYPHWVVKDEINKKLIFPTVLIVSDHPPDKINSPSGIRFILASMEDVKQNVYKLIWR